MGHIFMNLREGHRAIGSSSSQTTSPINNSNVESPQTVSIYITSTSQIASPPHPIPPSLTSTSPSTPTAATSSSTSGCPFDNSTITSPSTTLACPFSLTPSTNSLPHPLLSKSNNAALPSPISPLPTYPPGPHHLLQTSPYSTLPHLLSLDTVSPNLQLLALALTILEPVTSKYATTAYKDAFNWPVVISTLRALHQKHSTTTEGEVNVGESAKEVYPHTEAYVIVFRSRVPNGYYAPRLLELDEKAHEEANVAGGLLKYWFGKPDGDGRNLATCLWRHQTDAKAGGSGPGHKLAMREVAGHYLEWRVERLKLIVEKGAEGWDIVNW